jgi:hypothetical protein
LLLLSGTCRDSEDLGEEDDKYAAEEDDVASSGLEEDLIAAADAEADFGDKPECSGDISARCCSE